MISPDLVQTWGHGARQRVVPTDDVAAIVGAPVTADQVPGGGCTYNQDDPRAASISLGATSYDEGAGGMDGVRTGVTSVIEGTAADLDLGDGAFVVVGPSLGGDSQQGGGAIHVGASFVQVTLIQGSELPADVVTGLVTDVLALIESVA